LDNGLNGHSQFEHAVTQARLKEGVIGPWGLAALAIGIMKQQREGRREAVSEHKRGLILKAAREIFEAEGLEGASLRAIAARAGYTPAALYFHFDSKEAIYAQVLLASLTAQRSPSLRPDIAQLSEC
jgi:Bacterial regulatory proteins, tetR family